MSSTYIEGLGFVAVDSNKSPEDISATLDYYRNIAPQYKALGGFKEGFDDVKGIAYEAWSKLNRTDDENKNIWMKREIEEWGQQVGFTDSMQLEQYHREIEKLRELNEQEKADRVANLAMMENFKADMYGAYDNADGDISDVQQKYGYDEESLGILDSLGAMGKMLVTDTGYMAGQISGMLLKDPELLLLGALRIPAMAGQVSARMAQLATGALRVQPKYVTSLSKAIQGQRGRAVIGRGVEGAAYGGTYEALHDLTFKGHIDGANLERGIALGTLLGSAFGGLSKSTGAQSWFLNKQTSANAAKNIQQLKYSLKDPNLTWQKADKPLGADSGGGKSVLSWEKGWQEKLADIKAQNKGFVFNKATGKYEPPVDSPDAPRIDATGEPIDVNASNVNPDFVNPVRPKNARMPEGLTNPRKIEYWTKRVKQLIDHETQGFDNPSRILFDSYILDGLTPKQAAKKVNDAVELSILTRQKKLQLKKKKGERLYTDEEAAAIAVKEEARILEARNAEFIKKEGLNKHSTSGNKWGTRREQELADSLQNNEVIKTSKDFSHIFKQSLDDIKKAKITPMDYAVYGGVGAGVGALISAEDRTWGGILGLVGGLAVRRVTKGINVNEAKMRLRMYQVVNQSEGIMKTLQMESGKTVAVLHRVLKGKHPELSSLDFLTYLEHFSKKSKMIDGIDFGAKGRNKLSPEAIQAMEAYRTLMQNFEKVAKDVGVFGDRQFIKDYVTHIFRHKKLSDGDISNFVQQLKNQKNRSNLDNTSTYTNPRKLIEDLKTIAKGRDDIETDVFKILDAYTRSMSKAIAGKNITVLLERTAIVDGRNHFGVIISPKEFERMIKVADINDMPLAQYAKEKLGYQTSNHPALQGKLIHPLMKKSIDDFYAPEIGSEGVMNKILLVNNAMKRIAISFSFFHAQSLVFSGMYAGMIGEGMAATLAPMSKRGKAARARFELVRNVAKGGYENFGRDTNGKPIVKQNVHGREATGEVVGSQLLKEMAEEGVEVGVKASEYVDAGYNTIKGLMEKYAPPLDKAQSFIDKWTWDKTHDIGKMFVYLTMKDRMMQPKPRGIAKIMPVLSRLRGKDLGTWKPMEHAEAKQAAAAFTNDAFGGQRHSKLAMEWQQKAIANANNPKGALYNLMALWTTPSAAKYSNLVLFSPDWTISNLRIGFRGLGMTKDILGKIAKGGKLTSREMAEWNVYMGYLVRGVVATSAVAYIIHGMFGEEGESLDLQDFWLTGRLPLGTGEEMVVSKQIAEPMHWLKNPRQTFLNKSSSMPKIGLEIMLGKEYVSMKNGVLIGPQMDMGDPAKMAWWLAGKGTPISLSKIKRAAQDEDYGWEDVASQTMFGSIGFPTYGSKN